MQKKSFKLTAVSSILFLVLAPLTLIIFTLFFEKVNFYIPAFIIIVLSMIPFFVYFESRQIKTSEIVLVAMLVSLSVASRAVMAFVPQVKPICAIVMVSAISFGANVGFIVGSISMFISNFLFGQGMFTPFQMLGMGLCGFVMGLIFYKKKYANNRYAVSFIGAIVCFFVYGFLVDLCSVLMMLTSFSVKSVLSIFASGVSFNFIHALTTAVLLFFINKPMTDKFSRLRIKYNIFNME